MDVEGSRLRHVANGVVNVTASGGVAERLERLYRGVCAVIGEWAPGEAAVEETFVNVNPRSTLLLGQARGVVLLAPAIAGVPVTEYSTNLVKKAVVGFGHADKHQVGTMIRHLLPGCAATDGDAADALAVAICHAHHRTTALRWQQAEDRR